MPIHRAIVQWMGIFSFFLFFNPLCCCLYLLGIHWSIWYSGT